MVDISANGSRIRLWLRGGLDAAVGGTVMATIYVEVESVAAVYYVGGGAAVSVWFVPGTLDLEA